MRRDYFVFLAKGERLRRVMRRLGFTVTVPSYDEWRNV